MIASRSDLLAVLRQFNPWWKNERMTDLPSWKRAVFGEVHQWVTNPPARRALLLSGARQIGKTTLLLQSIEKLIVDGVPPGQIIYATFDHPLLKLAGLDGLLELWREIEPAREGTEYLFLDEIQYTKDWQTWLKLQVDFHKGRRITVTGSASPLVAEGQESGIGRWHTVRLATLSFYEYLQIKRVSVPQLPSIASLGELLDWSAMDCMCTAADALPLTGHFYDYLMRGGFPQCAQVESVVAAQKLLREDIVDKVLKRDMTALYGVRRVLEVEKIFLYLCYHDGGILDVPTLSRELDGINRQSVNNFLDLFEATHLICRLRPHGYGKEVLRGRSKIYLADAALPGAVLLLGRRLLEKPDRLGAAVETAFFKHVFTRYYPDQPSFSYWQDKKNRDLEVDLIAQTGDRIVPFEVKYQDAEPSPRKLKGLRLFLEEKKIDQGYVITQRWEDFSIIETCSARQGQEREKLDAKILAIPAPLACLWLSD